MSDGTTRALKINGKFPCGSVSGVRGFIDLSTVEGMPQVMPEYATGYVKFGNEKDVNPSNYETLECELVFTSYNVTYDGVQWNCAVVADGIFISAENALSSSDGSWSMLLAEAVPFGLVQVFADSECIRYLDRTESYSLNENQLLYVRFNKDVVQPLKFDGTDDLNKLEIFYYNNVWYVVLYVDFLSPDYSESFKKGQVVPCKNSLDFDANTRIATFVFGV